MLISIFIVAASLVLFFAHYFLFFSLIEFFGLHRPTDQWTLGITLFVLAVSFIGSLFLNHWRENRFTRALYYVSGLWLGLLTNLVLGFAFVWLILIFFHFIGFHTDGLGLGRTAIAIALLYSAWGVWNASHFVIKRITVRIPNLPENWRGKKIIQLSDVHLGLTNREDFMEKIAVAANEEKPAMVVITGDLFDGMDGDLLPFVAPIEDIQTEKGVYFVRGNHEIYVGLKEVTQALHCTKIRVLHDEVVDVDGLKIIGIEYPEDRHDEKVVDILKRLQKDYLGSPNILLYHVPGYVKQIKKLGVNLELCGHTHKGQIFPFGFVTRLMFHGFDYGLHADGDFSIYTTSGTGSWGPPMRTEKRGEIVAITLE